MIDAGLPSGTIVDAGGRATRVLAHGDGAPVVWLHDTLGNRWSAAHDALARDRRVLAPSLPGADDSTTLDGIDGPEDIVFWLTDLFDGLGLEKVTLLGCGLGGWMAAEYAVRHAARVERLVLVGAYGLRVPGALAEDEFALTPPMLRPLLFVDPASETALATVPDAEPPSRVAQTLHARVAAARLAWQFPYDRKLSGRLGRATMPTLVVWGARDGLVPLAHAHAYAAHLPRARVAILDEAAHYPYLEQPDAFAKAVSEFLG